VTKSLSCGQVFECNLNKKILRKIEIKFETKFVVWSGLWIYCKLMTTLWLVLNLPPYPMVPVSHKMEVRLISLLLVSLACSVSLADITSSPFHADLNSPQNTSKPQHRPDSYSNEDSRSRERSEEVRTYVFLTKQIVSTFYFQISTDEKPLFNQSAKPLFNQSASFLADWHPIPILICYVTVNISIANVIFFTHNILYIGLDCFHCFEFIK